MFVISKNAKLHLTSSAHAFVTTNPNRICIVAISMIMEIYRIGKIQFEYSL